MFLVLRETILLTKLTVRQGDLDSNEWPIPDLYAVSTVDLPP